jgi:hypothetical protein
VTAYISGVAYVLIGYTIRLVVYWVVYTAVYVYIVALVLDERSDKFFKPDRQGLLSEKSDDTANYPPLLTERVRQ